MISKGQHYDSRVAAAFTTLSADDSVAFSIVADRPDYLRRSRSDLKLSIR